VDPSGEKLFPGAPFTDHQARPIEWRDTRKALDGVKEYRVLSSDGRQGIHG